MSDTATTETLTAEQELANAFLSGMGDDAAASDVQPTPEEAAAAAAQPPAASPETPASPQWSPRVFTFERNGQEVTFTPSSAEEELAFIRRGYDYTQKTQEVAEERRKLQGIAKELHERETARQTSIREFFSDAGKIERYLQILKGQGGAAPGEVQPGVGDDAELEPVSRADLAKLRQELIAEAERKADEKASRSVRAILDDVSRQQLEAEYRTDFDQTLEGLLKLHPVLQDVEDVGELIRRDGKKAFDAQVALNPNRAIDPAVIKTAMEESAARRAQKLQGKLREREKVEAFERATLTTRGTEPPGGNAPAPPAQRKMKLNDPALDAQVIAEITALMK